MRVPWRVQTWWRDRSLARWRDARLASWQPLAGTVETGRLLALGDCNLADETGAEAAGRGRAGILGPLLRVADACTLVTANLESMLAAHGGRNGKTGSFLRARPDAVRAFEGGPPAVVTCANNHCMDHGAAALLECLSHLDRHGVRAAGAGATPAEADAAAVAVAGGVRIGFLGRCDDFRMQPGELARATPARLDPDALLAAVAALEREVDLVVVHLHMGYEFELHPLLHHRDLARACARAGADLVLVHHAHVPMGVEPWGRGLIAHGLGNACGPMDRYMRDGHPWTDRSCLLEVGFGPKGLTRYRLHPTRTDASGCMALPDPPEAARLLGGIARMSRRLADDRLLARITQARFGREGRGHLLALAQAHGRDADAFGEIAASLCAPRQETLLAHLDGLAPDAARLLRRVRDEGISAWHEGSFEAIRAPLDALDPPGRLPPGSVP
ncbi:MAG TPA: CapA family protein [Planctomycetota bacterium]|nr:CapA family protein [Planctomycetota bacterium]